MRPIARLLTWSWVGLAPLAASAATLSGPAEGSKAKIAVTPLQIEGELSDEAIQILEDELLGGLKRGGADIVGPEQAKTEGIQLPCGEGAGCIVKFARANEASHVLQVKVVKSGRDYALEMMLSSGNDGSTQAKTSQDCEICGLQELGELIGDQAAAFQPKLEAVPGMLIVETTPDGATVKVDGRIVGVTPVVEPIAAGEHTIVISKLGYLDRERKVTVVAGSEESISIGLQAAPTEDTPEVETGPNGKGMRIAGWVSLGVGVAAAGAGVPLILIDENPVSSRCTPEVIDENGVCRFQHNTLGAGLGLAATGGAALVAGAVLLGLGYKRMKQAQSDSGGKDEKKTAVVLPTGLGVLVRF